MITSDKDAPGERLYLRHFRNTKDGPKLPLRSGLTAEEWKDFCEEVGSRVLWWQTGQLFVIFSLIYASSHLLSNWLLHPYDGQDFSKEIGIAFLKFFALFAIFGVLPSFAAILAVDTWSAQVLKKIVAELHRKAPSCQVSIVAEKESFCCCFSRTQVYLQFGNSVELPSYNSSGVSTNTSDYMLA